jgi:5,10-methylenetetrahydrofolate reductase
MKKQTAVKWLVNQLNQKIDFIPMNKWDEIKDILQQAKEMEEKQMVAFAEFVATYPDKNKNADGEMLHAKSKYDGAERTIDLLKEYYKL